MPYVYAHYSAMRDTGNYLQLNSQWFAHMTPPGNGERGKE